MSELTKELLEELKENPDKLDDLEPNLKQEAIDSMTSGKVDFGVTEPENEDPEDPEKPKEEPKEEPKKENKTEPKDEPAWIKKVREAKEKQQAFEEASEKAKSRKTNFEKEYAESIKDLKVDTPDVYDEDFGKSVAEKNAKLEKKIELLEKLILERDVNEAEDASEKANKAKNLSIFAEIEGLQSEYKDQLKTANSFEKLNKDYNSYLNSIVKVAGLNDEKYKDWNEKKKQETAYQMFEDDPVFRKQAVDAGVDWPESLKNEEDRNKYFFITDLYDKKQNSGGSLKANFLEKLDSEGKLQEALDIAAKNAAIEASKKTVQSLTEPSIEEPSPNDGGGKDDYTKPSGEETNLADKVDLLHSKIRSGERLSPEESKELDQLIAALSGEGKE